VLYSVLDKILMIDFTFVENCIKYVSKL